MCPVCNLADPVGQVIGGGLLDGYVWRRAARAVGRGWRYLRARVRMLPLMWLLCV